MSDAGRIAEWFPGLESSSAEGSVRRCVLPGGAELAEEVVTSDPELMRFQYRIVSGPLRVEEHLATVDVIEDGESSLVVYSTEVKPDDLAPILAAALEGGIKGLKEYCENR